MMEPTGTIGDGLGVAVGGGVGLISVGVGLIGVGVGLLTRNTSIGVGGRWMIGGGVRGRVGMRKFVPTKSFRGSMSPLRLTMSRVVTPYCCAMAKRVSPDFTTWIISPELEAVRPSGAITIWLGAVTSI